MSGGGQSERSEPDEYERLTAEGHRRAEGKNHPSKRSAVAFGAAESQFVATYGATQFYNPYRWPTRDGIIPDKLFWMMYDEIPTVLAQRTITQARATAIGLKMFHEGTEASTKRLLSGVVEEAYPSR